MMIPRISKTIRHQRQRPHDRVSPSNPYSEEGRDLESQDVEKQQQESRRQTSTATSVRPSAWLQSQLPTAERPKPILLTHLPPELQAHVLRYLSLGDVVRLRRTCRYWRTLASPDLLRIIHGDVAFHDMLLSHCRQCLAYCPAGTARTFAHAGDDAYPLSSRCIPCALQSQDGTISVGRTVRLGDGCEYWPCRWCGWPVVGPDALIDLYRTPMRRGRNAGSSDFHHRCQETFFCGAVLAWLLVGCVQLALGVVGAALVWRYFSRRNATEAAAVVVPTAIGFVMSCACLYLLAKRYRHSHTYGWSLVMELGVLLSWVNPMRVLALEFTQGDATKASVAMLVLVALNMVFRLVNVLGNMLILTDYDRTRHHLPHVPSWRRRLVNPVLTGLIIWTYPEHVEELGPSR